MQNSCVKPKRLVNLHHVINGCREWLSRIFDQYLWKFATIFSSLFPEVKYNNHGKTPILFMVIQVILWSHTHIHTHSLFRKGPWLHMGYLNQPLGTLTDFGDPEQALKSIQSALGLGARAHFNWSLNSLSLNQESYMKVKGTKELQMTKWLIQAAF